MNIGQIVAQIAHKDAEYHRLRHNPLKLIRRRELERELEDLHRQHSELVTNQKEAELDRKEQKKLERYTNLVAAYDKAIPLGKKYDKWIADGGKLWAELSTLLNDMNANRSYPSNVHDNSLWFFELYVLQLLSQHGFGSSQLAGGSPPYKPLEEKLKENRELILSELG